MRYDINIDNDGDGKPDVTYRFHFTTEVRNPETFLYNTGTIESLDSLNWNRRQFYTVTRIAGEHESVIGSHLACPPCNIGPSSTPTYPALAQAAVHTLGAEGKVFAGQRQEGFYVDLGSAFDLLVLRPFAAAHTVPHGAGGNGVNATKDLNVHTIAIKVPIEKLTRGGLTLKQLNPLDPRAVIGVWGAASRRKVRIRQGEEDDVESGPWIQVSRLGNPLFNEVIVPMGHKDLWNSLPPSEDRRFVQYVSSPEVARLLPGLYPGVFPNLAARGTTNRGDLVAILLTGLNIPGFQNYTGPTYADMLRLNVAIPQGGNNSFGLLGGDAAGFPNGRRVFDDVVTIELQAIAGRTYPLVNPTYTPDGAALGIYDVTNPPAYPANLYQPDFPYLGVPKDGYSTPGA